MSETLHAYLVEHTVRETDSQIRLRAETAERFDAEMQIAPEQGQFFRFLIRALNVRRAFEVGTFTGYSALSIAMELPNDGSLDCLDVSEEYTAVARRFWSEAGVDAKITLRLGPGLDTLDRMIAAGASGRYDFAFVDADKEGYPAYYERAITLLRPGGVACFDNTLWSGAIADPGARDAETLAVRELNRLAFSDPAVLSCLVPIGDGLTMVWKR